MYVCAWIHAYVSYIQVLRNDRSFWVSLGYYARPERVVFISRHGVRREPLEGKVVEDFIVVESLGKRYSLYDRISRNQIGAFTKQVAL